MKLLKEPFINCYFVYILKSIYNISINLYKLSLIISKYTIYLYNLIKNKF
jgi:hypothetical protein